ncbi:MAG: spore photoproduct lyase family protein [Bacillota bacterium]
MVFVSSRVLFEKEALDYPLGRSLYERFSGGGFNIGFTGSHNRVTQTARILAPRGGPG